MSDATAVFVAVLLLAFNAFFVGAEFALISARRTQLEPRAAAGSRAARITLRAMENVSEMMAGAQLGITVCSLALGAIGEPAVAHLIEPWLDTLGVPGDALHPIAFAIALTIIVALHVVIGEMVPKNLALAGPERAALVLAPALVMVVACTRPFVIGLNAIANRVLHLLRVTPADEVRSTFTRGEVAGLVEQSHREGLLDVDSYELLTGALRFEERSITRIAIPTEQVHTVPREISRSELESRCAATGFSRFPVTAQTPNGGATLIGYVHVKDALTADANSASPLADTAIRPLATVPADAALLDALRIMQSQGAHLAKTVTANGVVSGVLMLEDVLEELVGEIRDANRRTPT